MLDICSACKKMHEKMNKSTDCITCPDKPPKTGHLSEYLIEFSGKATIARGGMGELDYSYVDKKIDKETDDELIKDALLDFINKSESIKRAWRDRK